MVEIVRLPTEPQGINPRIPSMNDAAIAKVRELEALNLQKPQIPIYTQHHIHYGMYSRTVFVPAGTLITGVLIKIPTLVTVQGEALIYIGEDRPFSTMGYHVMAASAGRRQAFYAVTDIVIQMVFPTKATMVEEAEREFTDEYDLLASHRDQLGSVTITGE